MVGIMSILYLICSCEDITEENIVSVSLIALQVVSTVRVRPRDLLALLFLENCIYCLDNKNIFLIICIRQPQNIILDLWPGPVLRGPTVEKKGLNFHCLLFG